MYENLYRLRNIFKGYLYLLTTLLKEHLRHKDELQDLKSLKKASK
jgi:hypothetical protein